MVLTLYYTPGSAPCSQVILTAKALNLDLELKTVDLFSKEQLKPEYIKMNPQHVVPTLVDGDFVLWESRAISRYLASKYGAGGSLYPQEPQARALVEQRLDFDLGTLYQRFAEYFYPQIFEKKDPEEAKLARLEEALGFLNTFLEGSKYAAGSELTIADLALVASVAVFEVAGVSFKAFPNLERWFELVKSTAPAYDEACQKYCDAFKDLVEQLLKKA